jgi:hypothetical protein
VVNGAGCARPRGPQDKTGELAGSGRMWASCCCNSRMLLSLGSAVCSAPARAPPQGWRWPCTSSSSEQSSARSLPARHAQGRGGVLVPMLLCLPVPSSRAPPPAELPAHRRARNFDVCRRFSSAFASATASASDAACCRRRQAETPPPSCQSCSRRSERGALLHAAPRRQPTTKSAAPSACGLIRLPVPSEAAPTYIKERGDLMLAADCRLRRRPLLGLGSATAWRLGPADRVLPSTRHDQRYPTTITRS